MPELERKFSSYFGCVAPWTLTCQCSWHHHRPDARLVHARNTDMSVFMEFGLNHQTLVLKTTLAIRVRVWHEPDVSLAYGHGGAMITDMSLPMGSYAHITGLDKSGVRTPGTTRKMNRATRFEGLVARWTTKISYFYFCKTTNVSQILCSLFYISAYRFILSCTLNESGQLDKDLWLPRGQPHLKTICQTLI